MSTAETSALAFRIDPGLKEALSSFASSIWYATA